MSAEERAKAGINTAEITKRTLDETLRLPAEVIVNAYESARVTPRIVAQVEKRHVRLGDRVTTGQRLLTLTSVAMAEAEGNLIVADREWQRVKSLGQQAVSERRYTEAQVAQQQALAKVLAYGMTQSQASELLKSGDATRATGQFDLLAPLAGTILRDDFIMGELIEPGRVLFEISDESTLWVEARTVPSTLSNIEIGTPARVSVNGIEWLEGAVIQFHHQLDETTRTQAVRIEVKNTTDQLHPGQFVEAEIVTGATSPVLAIPNDSLILIEGMPTVFKLEDGGEFHAESVITGVTIGGWTIIEAGLEPGDVIAISGVFHLKSLLLKSSLGEGHGH
jgi:cobalt-zinc-cadmium efflux system membrane fusion protein